MYKPFIFMFAIFSFISLFIYLNFNIESPFQWNNDLGRFFDIVIFAPFIEEVFYRSFFVFIIFSVLYPLIFFFNQKSEDNFDSLKHEFQRMLYGVETEPSKMFLIVGLIFLIVNQVWANNHHSQIQWTYWLNT